MRCEYPSWALVPSVASSPQVLPQPQQKSIFTFEENVEPNKCSKGCELKVIKTSF